MLAYTLSRREVIARVLQSAAFVTLARGAAADAWKPQVLTVEQNASLAAIGERILPGSAAANCNRVIDLILTVETPEVRTQLLDAIGAFETAAQKQDEKIFKDLLPEQQDQLIALQAQQPGADQPFAVIKEWIADVYWSSQDGLRELGWNGQMAWSSFPGCDSHSAS